MPFLISNAEKCSLRIGTNTLGGRGPDAVALTSLAELPPAAVITVQPDGSAVLQRVSAGVVVKVDEEPLGTTPHTLVHGARLAVGSARLMFADPAAERAGSTPNARGGDNTSEAPTEIVPSVPATDQTGRLIALRTGRGFPVPTVGLVIGRGGVCDIVVDEKGISRRHAVVKPDGPGFTVSDESANGTFVNDVRVPGVQMLRQGDVIRMGTEEFRLEVDAVMRASSAAPQTATELVAGVPGVSAPRGSSRRPPGTESGGSSAAPRLAPARALAILEVTGGPLARKQFRVERAACAIGRSEENDVRLTDKSVSALHATLLLKRGTWYAVDLQSANGTYVDGYRVAGERPIADGGTLRTGDIVMTFRALTGAPEVSQGTQPAGGRPFRRLAKLWQA